MSKSESVSHFQEGLLLNKRDGMSKIALHFPSMFMGASGHAPCIFRCRARAWTRCLATIDHFDVRPVDQPTDGELLQKSVIHFSWRGLQIHLIAGHNMSRLAILRSEFEVVPIQFWGVSMFARVFSDHCHLNTVGV